MTFKITFYAMLICICVGQYSLGQVLDKVKLMQSATGLDNRDLDWYLENIPFFECPDTEITTTYYYRWDLLTKHLTYGSPNSGYSFTEFIDRPFWSGAYGAISCPAGLQLYEARWLRSPRIANDYSKYWFLTPGAQPRNYSTWIANAVAEIDKVHPNRALLIELLPHLVANYKGWEKRHYVSDVGLFWQTGHDDGMEFNINSRQTKDILRGAPSYRPSFNAYMWADATAIASIATLDGQSDLSHEYASKAKALKEKMIELMWDEKRQFFFPVLKNDEERDGHRLKALTRTYESGEHAGDPHGRELIGYVPWQFGLLSAESRFDIAWKKLMDRDGFFADFGPTTVERNDPLFVLKNSCCWWSGQSWPYATTQTLKGLANNLQSGSRTLSVSDYVKLLSIYARSHRKNGKPYLAEAIHPDTGSFEGHDGYNHSEHYFHSGYCDLVITGLVGLIPRNDETLEIKPLVSENWDYFALENVRYRGHNVSIVWDKSGMRYSQGAGLQVLVDGKQVFQSERLVPVLLDGVLPSSNPSSTKNETAGTTVNFAVNNDGYYYPRLIASFTAEGTSLSKLNDGNYWYLRHPPNRWTCEGSSNEQDWIEIDMGMERQLHTLKAFVLDDREIPDSKIRAPKQIAMQYWDGLQWKSATTVQESVSPEGHRPHVFRFEALKTRKLRLTLLHSEGYRSGLSEIEVWGDEKLPITNAPPPLDNLAYNDGSKNYPVATASHADRFGGVPKSAIDGITNFLPTPTNRWTSYESKSNADWLQIDFGKPVEFRRVEMAIYDDRGGVQPPSDYSIEVWAGQEWQPVEKLTRAPQKPLGGQWNIANFQPTTSEKLRIVFTHAGKARSGVTEVTVWNEPANPSQEQREQR